MGEFRLTLGGTVDVATPSEVAETVDNAITGLQGHIDKKFMGMSRGRWSWRTISAAATQTFTSGGTFQLTLNPANPAVGKVWVVRRVTITGGDDHSTVPTLTAALYAGDPYNFALTQCIIPGQVIPYFSTFGTNSIPIKDSEQLFVNFTASGSLPFQELQVSAAVMEWNECDIENQYA